ncbi:GIT1 is required for uptake of glycerophosphoinositol [Rasamsonia emersonii CBS 393.64]|uniref:GIT1 is required for uptake of glycerophosphoinositol n=1 Tax=Rasamsonia emersonii (strain ATCC 16479 / CBS 393.64 / IMI 116815) TaxID=1408163 RepID=A0A0F4YKJ6_RASE3|nr:GIT1 is required for uptake of glycerophosphoinositol [Rasamsonia emersonii CBS 393.64]KKA18620.1 GIT1 is required for uptake of glycerophosphoinositol [Rasamsonia emersonii CBS 393.64]
MDDMLSVLVPRDGGAGSAPPPCDTGNEYDGRMGLRISSIFVILVGSLFGAVFPVLARRMGGSGIPPWAFFIAKYFGSGVIIATAFIHLLAPAEEALTNPCLTGPITEYSWVEGIILMTVVVMFFVELMVMRYSRFGTGHGHDHGEESEEHHHLDAVGASDGAYKDDAIEQANSHVPGDDHLGHSREHRDAELAKTGGTSLEDYAAQLTAIFILEFGIIFHSVFIGLTLAVTGEEFTTLYVVLVFHQTFEGLGLGSRLATIPWPRTKRWTPRADGARVHVQHGDAPGTAPDGAGGVCAAVSGGGADGAVGEMGMIGVSGMMISASKLIDLAAVKIKKTAKDYGTGSRFKEPGPISTYTGLLDMSVQPDSKIEVVADATPPADVVPVQADDDAGPSGTVSKSRQSLSDLFTIFAAGFALISDGYQNNLILTCDYLGRKWAIVLTTLMIVVGGILATAAHGTTINGMFWMLTIARGIVGFGTGGEYPASSTSASEAANELTLDRRGPYFILVTNLPLSFGGPFAVSVFLIVYMACQQSHLSTVWRVCFGIGCIWPLTVFYFRIRMLNSVLYRRGAIKRKVPYRLVIKYYWKTLIGTCGAWFLYDFVTFPNGVFSGTIISSIVGKDGSIRKTAEWQLLLGAIALPGVLIGAWLCDRIGRKNTMMLGFSGYLIFGLIIGCAYDKITNIMPLFVVFYGLMQSSGNLGPGDMLGLLSSESYATAVRGTCYGLSAAIGKVGAAVGTEAFTPIENNLGKRWTFIIAAICGVVGILVTYFFVPDLTGEDLKFRDERFRAYLVANGWEGKMGESDLKAVAGEGIPQAVVEEVEKVAASMQIAYNTVQEVGRYSNSELLPSGTGLLIPSEQARKQ